MNHRAVPGDDSLVNLVRLNPLLLTDPLDQLIERTYHQPLQLFQPAVLAGIDDAADDVLTASNLAVIVSRLLGHIPVDQVYQIDYITSGADVDGQSPVLITAVTRQHVHQAGWAARHVPGVRLNDSRYVPMI